MLNASSPIICSTDYSLVIKLDTPNMGKREEYVSNDVILLLHYVLMNEIMRRVYLTRSSCPSNSFKQAPHSMSHILQEYDAIMIYMNNQVHGTLFRMEEGKERERNNHLNGLEKYNLYSLYGLEKLNLHSLMYGTKLVSHTRQKRYMTSCPNLQLEPSILPHYFIPVSTTSAVWLLTELDHYWNG